MYRVATIHRIMKHFIRYPRYHNCLQQKGIRLLNSQANKSMENSAPMPTKKCENIKTSHSDSINKTKMVQFRNKILTRSKPEENRKRQKLDSGDLPRPGI